MNELEQKIEVLMEGYAARVLAHTDMGLGSKAESTSHYEMISTFSVKRKFYSLVLDRKLARAKRLLYIECPAKILGIFIGKKGANVLTCLRTLKRHGYPTTQITFR